MTFFDILQLLGGFILALGYIPQIIQIISTRSCKDLNLRTYLAMALGIGLMEIYAIHLVLNDTGLMFLITNSVSLLLVISIVFLIVAFKRKTTAKIPTEKEADVICDEENDELLCPSCLHYIAPGEALTFIDMKVPKYCPNCGQKLHY